MIISAKILKALATPGRLRILKHLTRQPAGVSELAEKLQLSQSNVSRDLKVLREAGIVEARREGSRIEQRIVDKYRCAGADDCLDFGCCVMRFDRLKE